MEMIIKMAASSPLRRISTFDSLVLSIVSQQWIDGTPESLKRVMGNFRLLTRTSKPQIVHTRSKVIRMFWVVPLFGANNPLDIIQYSVNGAWYEARQ